MEKNLEKIDSKKKSVLVEEDDVSGLQTDEDLEILDTDFDFDEDGTLTVTDDDEDDDAVEEDDEQIESDTEVEETVETEEEDTVEDAKESKPKVESKKRGLSPAEIKLINLKKELAQAQKELIEKEKQLQVKANEQEKENLREELVKKGYDPEYAESFAESKIEIKQLKEKAAIADFKDENEDVFSKYPQARVNAATIMRNVQLTGMTAEQICIGLYGEKKVSDMETRAIKAAQGISTKEVKQETGSGYIPSATTKTAGKGLSRTEQLEKREFERVFNQGKPLTEEEYRKSFKN